MRGWKAFDENMQCRGKQYSIGETYTHEGELEMCEKGLHFCENPLDVLNYYDILTSRFAEVEAQGQILQKQDGEHDSKCVTNILKIVRALSLSDYIHESVGYLCSQLAASGDGSKLAASGYRAKLAASGVGSKLAASGDNSQLAASGDNSQLAASGDGSQLAASGDRAKLAASGYRAKLAASGDSSKIELKGNYLVGAAIGDYSCIRGGVGCWITLAEWGKSPNGDYTIPLCVKSAQIDGQKIKADTWYQLKNGEFVEKED